MRVKLKSAAIGVAAVVGFFTTTAASCSPRDIAAVEQAVRLAAPDATEAPTTTTAVVVDIGTAPVPQAADAPIIGLTAEATCATFSVHGVGLDDASKVMPSLGAADLGQGYPTGGVFDMSYAIGPAYAAGYHWAVTYLAPGSLQGQHIAGNVTCP